MGMVTHPQAAGRNLDCLNWLRGLLARGVEVRVPEICDYELRRELVRCQKAQGIAKLNALGAKVGYLPITTSTIRRACNLWAQLRNTNQATASDDALDGDVILAAHALILSEQPEYHGTRIVVATSNVGHLTRMVDADEWANITP